MRPFLRGEYDCRVCDYRDVDILPNSIVICDIPYIGTREYRGNEFDHDTFYQWALDQESPVFICEYNMPESDFICVKEWDRVSTYSATNNNYRVVEKLFIPSKWKEWWNGQKKEPQQLELFQ